MSRPSPVRDRLLDLLRQERSEAGVSTVELAVRMGRSTVYVNTMLGRLRAYGYVRKITDNSSTLPHELNRWSLPKC